MNEWRKFILGCTVGNMLEWYDFILYGYFAHIFSVLFFPSSSEFLSLFLAYAVFAIGCVMRPVGSAFFGHIGDKLGRKKALMITIILISLATISMGLLPTYAEVGVAAPILLTMCRLLQGMAVSGEEVGAAVFLTENAPLGRQGLAGAIILSSVYTGLLLGAIVVFIVIYSFSHEALLSYAWRIPFLCSSVFGVIAFYIRMSDVESPKFIQHSEKLHSLPFVQVVRHHLMAVVGTVALSAILAVSIYLFVVYLPTFFTMTLYLSLQQALLVSVVALFVMSILVLFVGLFADRVGTRNVFAVGCLGFIAMAYPIFLLLSYKTFWGVFFAETLLIACLALIAGSIFPLLINNFPVDVCYTGVGLGFNIGMTVFGSTTPLIVMSLIQYTGSSTSPFWYLFFSAIVSFIALPFFTDGRPIILEDTFEGDMLLETAR